MHRFLVVAVVAGSLLPAAPAPAASASPPMEIVTLRPSAGDPATFAARAAARFAIPVRHVYHAALLDPNAAGTLSPEAICAMVDDLIDAHGDAIDERIRAGNRRSVSPA